MYLERSQDWLAATWQQYLRETNVVNQAGGTHSGVYEVVKAALHARLPGSGNGIDNTGLAPALQGVEAAHAFFPGSVDALGKHWAYTHSLLGQPDTSIVADKPNYAVFGKNGTRTLVALNRTNSSITVTFKDGAIGSTVGTVKANPDEMATKVVGCGRSSCR